MPGMRTFAILDPGAPECEWCGRTFTSDIMAVFAKDREFRSISPSGFDVYTLSFTEEQMAGACERLGIPDVASKLEFTDSTVQLDPVRSGELRRLVDVSLQALCFSNPQVAGTGGSDYLPGRMMCE